LTSGIEEKKMGMRSNILNNRYRLDKKIGEGGFAHVFLATDLLLSRQVAVKVMEESQIKDKSYWPDSTKKPRL
jgi:serine/threonine protein kinase